MRAKWRTPRRAGGSVLKKLLTPPTLLEMDVKRPTLSCDLRRVVRSQSAVCRLTVQVDSRTLRRFPLLIRPDFAEENFGGR